MTNILSSSAFFNNEAMDLLLQKLGTFETSINQLTDTTNRMSERIARIEKAIRIPAMPNNGVGEVVSINCRSLQQVAKTFATKSEMEEARKSIQVLSSCNDDLKTRFSHHQQSLLKDMETKFDETMSTTIKSIDTVKDDFEYRIDRAEDALRTQAKFMKQTAPTLKHLQIAVDDLIQSSSKTIKKQSLTEEQISQINKEVNNRQDIIVINERIHSLTRAVESMVDKDAMLIFEKEIKDLKIATKNTKTLTLSQNQQIKTMKGMMLEKSDMTTYASQSQLNTVMESIRNELMNKVCQDKFNELHQTVENLTQDYLVTRDKAHISADFVEWLSSKDEAYERNLTVVDRHLRDLAVKSTGINSNSCQRGDPLRSPTRRNCNTSEGVRSPYRYSNNTGA